MTRADKRNGVGDVNSVAPNRNSARLGWIILALIVITLPAQAAWYALTSSEPYPALTQPPFKTVPGADGTLSGRTESLTVVLADGSSVPLDTGALFSDSWNQGSFVIDTIASQADLDRQSRARLRDEVAKFLPAGADPAFLRVVTQQREYRLDENRGYPVSAAQSTIVPLGDEG